MLLMHGHGFNPGWETKPLGMAKNICALWHQMVGNVIEVLKNFKAYILLGQSIGLQLGFRSKWKCIPKNSALYERHQFTSLPIDLGI